MRKAILIYVTIGLLLLAQSATAGIEEAYRGLEQGNALHKKGKYKEAAQQYKDAWEKGKLPDACFNLALTYDRDLNDNQAAVKYYNEFLKNDPNAVEADEVRNLIDKAKQEISQSSWWFEKQAKDPNKNEEHGLVEAVRKIQKEAPDADPNRAEDSYPSQAHICLGCHANFMGPQINMASTHPTGRVPKGKLAETVPKNVRFYPEGQVVCLSCHNPTNLHFESGTPGINYKYLRVQTEGKDDLSRFCAYCHSSKSSSRFLGDGESAERRPGSIRE